MSAIHAPHEHDVTAGGSPGRSHTAQDVDIVISASAGTIHRDVKLTYQADWVYRLGTYTMPPRFTRVL
jgi:hypothetical protein